MLKQFNVHNFKSIKAARLNMGRVTFVVGANASGKSNLIESIALLAWLGRGGQLPYLQHAIDSGELPIRGSVQDLAGDDDEPIGLGCQVEPIPDGTSTPVHVETQLRPGPVRAAIVGESLTDPGVWREPLYTVVDAAAEGSHDLKVAYNSFKRGSNPTVTCLNDRPVFAQLDSPARFRESHSKAQQMIPSRARHVRQALSQILILAPAPSKMRGYAYQIEKELQPDGANLSAVLHELTEVDSLKSEVLEFVRALPEQEITDIRYIRTPRNEVMLQLVETFDGRHRPCDGVLLSDGTLRVLAVAAALLSVPEKSTVIIEEIDNGVHPSRIEMLAGRIRAVADRRQLRVILTSHNATMLDAIPPADFPSVVVCRRDPKSQATELLSLQDVRFLPQIIGHGALGQLFTQGTIERYLRAESAPRQSTGTEALLELLRST